MSHDRTDHIRNLVAIFLECRYDQAPDFAILPPARAFSLYAIGSFC